MTKRTPGLPRSPQNFYPTPIPAFVPVFPWLALEAGIRFAEPCAGQGHLVGYMRAFGYTCAYTGDITRKRDALKWTNTARVDFIITNPPWDRESLHPMIERFAGFAPTWLLIDADWMHTIKAAPLIRQFCTDIVPIGRVKWFPGTRHQSFDNACWYRFTTRAEQERTVFHPRGMQRFT